VAHRSLAKAAVEQELVGSISHATAGNVRRKAKLQPHRFRYWKTTVWDDEAVARTLKIL
jgi:hypothetical protein